MLKDLQHTQKRADLTDRVVEILGMESLDALEKDWKSFVEKLQ